MLSQALHCCMLLRGTTTVAAAGGCGATAVLLPCHSIFLVPQNIKVLGSSLLRRDIDRAVAILLFRVHDKNTNLCQNLKQTSALAFPDEITKNEIIFVVILLGFGLPPPILVSKTGT